MGYGYSSAARIPRHGIQVLYSSIDMQAVHQAYALHMIYTSGRSPSFLRESFTYTEVQALLTATHGVIQDHANVRRPRITLHALLLFCEWVGVSPLQVLRLPTILVFLEGEVWRVRLRELVGAWV